jgi:hypothetical protein
VHFANRVQIPRVLRLISFFRPFMLAEASEMQASDSSRVSTRFFPKTSPFIQPNKQNKTEFGL